MANDLVGMKRAALRLGLCDAYRGRWDAADDRRALVDLCCGADGMEFMAGAAAGGWGLSAGYILRTFGEYVNGGYVHRGAGGYTGEVLAGELPDGYTLRCTLTLAVGVRGVLRVGEHTARRLYVCGGSDIVVECAGECYCRVYGANAVRVVGGGYHGYDVPRSEWFGVR